ncbi:MAG: hypothetical protein HRU15_10955, partial [Planctomycetes bacterium]|nr:hypothetical protein [Planctomycetota bacterium]
TYTLDVDVHIEQQEALAGSSARVMLRPQLFLHGQPVSLSDLKNISVSIDAVTIDNVHSTSVLDNIQLNEVDAWVHDIRMPERVQLITVSVRAEIEHFSTGINQKLRSSALAEFNGLMKSQQFKDVYLRPTAKGYYLDVLGRNGETYNNESITRIEFKHRDFTSTQHFSFRSNAQGSIYLGALKDISNIRVVWNGKTRQWYFNDNRQMHSNEFHIRSGEDLTLAWSYAADHIKACHLISLRADKAEASYSSHLSLDGDGRLLLRALPAGDYQLRWPLNAGSVRIIVEEGDRHHDGIFGAHRILSDTVPHGLSIAPMEVAKDHYRFMVSGYSEATRVHVVATRYQADVSLIDSMGSIAKRDQSEFYPYRNQSYFVEKYRLSDEHRYILDRSRQTIYPTLMLKRPALLIHPWERSDTNTFMAIGAGGGASGAYGARSSAGKKSASRYGGGAGAVSLAGIASYDFLQYGAVVLSNLAIDKDGYVSIPKELFDDQQQLQILAVEPEQAYQRTDVLNPQSLQRREQRLMKNLADSHKRHSRSVAIVASGDKQQVARDPSSWRVLSSVAEAFELLDTLCSDARLHDFEFLKRWPLLSGEDKEKFYSDFACHELHVFLYMKDRAFFDAHIATTLGNKHDKTFIDHYLLEDDLTPYLRPWAFARLNAFERALLARRGGATGAGILRSLSETVELQVRNSSRDEFLFYTALRGKALQAPASPVVAALKSNEARQQLGESKMQLRRSFNKRAKKESMDKISAISADEDGMVEEMDMEVEEMELEDAPAAPGAKGYFAKDRKAKNKAKRLFRQLDSTKEWAENNYYKRHPHEQIAQLVQVNDFWEAYAAHQPADNKVFINKYLSDCSNNATEVLLALAVTDLPFAGEKHVFKEQDQGYEITVASPALVYFMSFADVQAAGDKPLVSIQNLYRMNDRYRHEKGQRIEKFIKGPCLYRDVYGAQVVFTNPTARPFQVDVLAQIPQGSIPLNAHKATLGKTMTLAAYSIERINMQFYFPEAGNFSWYAASLNDGEKLLAQAEVRSLDVRTELPDTDRSSWQYIADFGSDEQVIAYLKTHNIQRLDVSRIAFRMHQKNMFRSVIDILQTAHVYAPVLWSYGFKHLSLAEMKQWMEHNQRAVQLCGAYFTSPLLHVDAIERAAYEHLEYYPLVNARSHKFGGKQFIANSALAQHYSKFLHTLVFVPQLRDHDHMATVIYYLAQDRIEDAIALFTKIERNQLPQKMQYDYCKAYLALCQEDLKTASDICKLYSDIPIVRWQQSFAHMSAQIAEISDDTARVVDPQDRNQEMALRAMNEVMLDLESQGDQLRISYRNITSCTINYYRMNLELLFSRNAFMRGEGGQFAYIAPNFSKETALPEGKNVTDISLPPELKQGNVLVEVVASGLRRRLVLFVNQLQVLTQDNFGQLQVRHKTTGKVKSKVYVKVYARMQGGAVKFYKDGYTDLRGRFDYASISTNDLDDVERFSILLVDKTDGTLVSEVNPPAR